MYMLFNLPVIDMVYQEGRGWVFLEDDKRGCGLFEVNLRNWMWSREAIEIVKLNDDLKFAAFEECKPYIVRQSMQKQSQDFEELPRS